MPSLVIGLSEEVFWKQTPKTLMLYFEADKQKQLRQQQNAWLIGAYVKSALSSTIIVAGLADKNTAGKLPKYPDAPKLDDYTNGEREYTKEEIAAQNKRLELYMESLIKVHNGR